MMEKASEKIYPCPYCGGEMVWRDNTRLQDGGVAAYDCHSCGFHCAPMTAEEDMVDSTKAAAYIRGLSDVRREMKEQADAIGYLTNLLWGDYATDHT